MKTSKQCPKCQSLRIGYLEEVQDKTDITRSDTGEGYMEPKSVGFVEEPSFWAGTKRMSVGQFEAYVCADCGYFEHYVKSPESVEFEKLKGFHWVNPDKSEAGPYR